MACCVFCNAYREYSVLSLAGDPVFLSRALEIKVCYVWNLEVSLLVVEIQILCLNRYDSTFLNDSNLGNVASALDDNLTATIFKTCIVGGLHGDGLTAYRGSKPVG